MDPIIIGLGAKIIDVLILYVKKGAEKFAQDVGETAAKKVKMLYETLKTRLSGDKTASDMLDEFQKDPLAYKLVLEKILQKKLEQDKDLADELARNLNEIDIKIIQEIDDAENVTGIEGNIKKGKAEVKQKAKKARDMTGVKGNIG